MVGIDTEPVYKDGFLRINAANKEGNAVWFLARVYQGEEKIAQTVAYEPETYHSEGVSRITCEVCKE